MPFLDDLPGIHDVTVNGGSAVPRRSILNIVGAGVVIADNKTAGRTDVFLPSTVSGGTVTPDQLAADANNYYPVGGDGGTVTHATATLERWSTDGAPRNVTGLDAGGLSRLVIANVGAATITLKHESASSLAANRFLCPGSADYALAATASIALVRDSVSVRWRVVS